MIQELKNLVHLQVIPGNIIDLKPICLTVYVVMADNLKLCRIILPPHRLSPGIPDSSH